MVEDRSSGETPAQEQAAPLSTSGARRQGCAVAVAATQATPAAHSTGEAVAISRPASILKKIVAVPTTVPAAWTREALELCTRDSSDCSEMLRSEGGCLWVGGFALRVPADLVARPGTMFVLDTPGGSVTLDEALSCQILDAVRRGHVALAYTSSGYFYDLDLTTWCLRCCGHEQVVGVRVLAEPSEDESRDDGCVVREPGSREELVRGYPMAAVWVFITNKWVRLHPEMQQQLLRGQQQRVTLAAPAAHKPSDDFDEVTYEMDGEADTCAGAGASSTASTASGTFTFMPGAMLLCEFETKLVYPVRVTETADPESTVLRAAGQQGIPALRNGWQWQSQVSAWA